MERNGAVESSTGDPEVKLGAKNSSTTTPVKSHTINCESRQRGHLRISR